MPGIANVIAIAAGDEHTIALRADKTVWTWGSDSSGQLGWNANQFGTNPTPGLVTALSNVVAIAGGVGYSLAVTSNGQVYAWGDNTFGQLGTYTSTVPLTNSPMLVTGINNAVWVSAGRSDDDLGAVTSNTNYVGGVHSLVMTLDQGTNHFWGWGDNSYGQVGNVTNGGATNLVSQYTPAGPLQFCTRCQRQIQLGTNGTLYAQCNGTLYLYFNDEIGAFIDDAGFYNVTFNGSNVTVMATNYAGVAVGTVTNGGVYTYSATGTCFHTISPLSGSDASGNQTNGMAWACSDINVTNTICPMWQCYSLVGKIQ